MSKNKKPVKRSTYNCYICGYADEDSSSIISYFKFPKEYDFEKRKQWLHFANLDENTDVSYLRLCHKHFANECVKLGQGRYILSKNAIPTLLKTIDKRNQVIPTVWKNRCLLCPNKDTGQRLTTHTFPVSPDIKKEWAIFCNLTVDEIFPRDVLCQRHFKDDDYVTLPFNKDKCRRILKPNAIPSIYYSRSFVSRRRRYKKTCIVCGYKGDNITYFSFPRDKKLLEEWLSACDLEDLNISKPQSYLRLYVCSRHFIDADFAVCESGCKLKENAVPTMHLDPLEFIDYDLTISEDANSSNFIDNGIDSCLMPLNSDHNYSLIDSDDSKEQHTVSVCHYTDVAMQTKKNMATRLCKENIIAKSCQENSDNQCVINSIGRNLMKINECTIMETLPENTIVETFLGNTNEVERMKIYRNSIDCTDENVTIETVTISSTERNDDIRETKNIFTLSNNSLTSKTSNSPKLKEYRNGCDLDDIADIRIPTTSKYQRTRGTVDDTTSPRSRLRFIGDFKISDVENSPGCAIACLRAAKQCFAEKNKKIRTLRQKVRRLEKSEKRLRDLVAQLRSNKSSKTSKTL